MAEIKKPVYERGPIPGVKNVVAVYACKGGVGKSSVAVNLAVALSSQGRIGLLDADIYGPNVPLMMGIEGQNPKVEQRRPYPIDVHGVKVMSMGFLAPRDSAKIWRGPMVHGAVRQFLRDTRWGDLDCLIVDLPPGTGDAPLTLIQQVPLAGVVVVTTPQDVSLLDGVKGIHMFQKLRVPILGIVENMSGFTCPHCHKDTPIFSTGGGEREAKRLGVPFLGALPLDPRVVAAGDSGVPFVIQHPDADVSRAIQSVAQAVRQQLAAPVSPAH